jgi:hypothetical protein
MQATLAQQLQTLSLEFRRCQKEYLQSTHPTHLYIYAHIHIHIHIHIHTLPHSSCSSSSYHCHYHL